MRFARLVTISCLLLLAATTGVFGQAKPTTPQSKEGGVSKVKPAQFVTRADLENRAAELRQQLEQAKANLAAISGAIQDCEYWLDRMKEQKPEAKTQEPERVLPQTNAVETKSGP